VRILVGGIFVALAIALAFIVWDFNLDVLATVFLSQPGPKQIAWTIVVAASLLLLWLALWQSEILSKQRKVGKHWSIGFVESGKTSIGSRRDNLMSNSQRIMYFAPIRKMLSALSTSGLAGLNRWYNRSICAMRQVTSRPA
jgi:hypothetical protein